MKIVDHRLRKLVVPCDPPISDSATDDHEYGIAYLELEADSGEVGVGFGGTAPTTPPDVLDEEFADTWEAIRGGSPFVLKERMRRPRGGNYGQPRHGGITGAVDVALWDLCGKHLGRPVYELMGGDDPAVPAYASGLHFTLDDGRVKEHYENYADRGFDAAKVKVGYPTVEEDLDRLRLVREAMGGDPTLMVDANEAWSPKEAIRRAHAYRDAGLEIYWIEDPILRDDLEGHRRVSEAVPFAHLNAGEYVNLEGKRRLLERGAVDVLHLSGGLFSTARAEAALGHAFGVPVALHDSIGHVGVHLAAALPELAYYEYWPRPWDDLVEAPMTVEDGTLVAPDGPGHGVRFSGTAFERYGEG